MKNLTRLLLAIHVIFVFVCMWGAPFIIYMGFQKCQMTKMTLIWLALMFGQFIHWKLLKHECILSLLEKKIEDPSYVMGSNPGKSHIWSLLSTLMCTDMSDDDWKTFHFEFTKMNILLGIGLVTIGNMCVENHKLPKTAAFIATAHAINRYLNHQRKTVPK